LSVGMTQQFFVFFVPGDLYLWPLTLTFELGRDFCTVYLTAKFDRPTFSRSEVIERTNMLTNWQTNTLTNRRRWKHPLRSAVLQRLLTYLLTYLRRWIMKAAHHVVWRCLFMQAGDDYFQSGTYSDAWWFN